MTKLEEVARAICWNRAMPACNCRAQNVKCRAPIENLLHGTNPIGYQARGVLKIMRHTTEVMVCAADSPGVRLPITNEEICNMWNSMVDAMIVEGNVQWLNVNPKEVL